MKILIAEDDRDIVLLYKHTIEKRHHEVITSEDGEECLTIYHEEFQRARFGKRYSVTKTPQFDAVVLDHKMPKINGMEVAKEILANKSTPKSYLRFCICQRDSYRFNKESNAGGRGYTKTISSDYFS